MNIRLGKRFKNKFIYRYKKGASHYNTLSLANGGSAKLGIEFPSILCIYFPIGLTRIVLKPLKGVFIVGKVFNLVSREELLMKNRKVLIVDDEEDFGLLMTHILNAKKYEVFLAHTLEDGMRLLEKECPGIIFLDNRLPDGCGWGRAEYILTNYPEIELTLISGINVPKTSASNFRILEKPIASDELDAIFD